MSTRIIEGDCREVLASLESGSVQTCVTSPPYFGLRDYQVAGQIGLERTPDEYVAQLVEVFREVRRVLRDDGTLWCNLGDSYASGAVGFRPGCGRADGIVDERKIRNRNGTPTPPGYKQKDLIGIPWAVAFALRGDGWYLRSDIIWHKPNPMPESVTDRPTKSHEYLFLLTKQPTYYYDADAIKEASVTQDIRRPYGSQGAWDLDGRPDEQKHGGEPRSFKGSHFNTGKTAEHQLGRASKKQRKPAGWDTGAGGHGSFHREGRAREVEYTETAGESRNKRSVWTVATAPFSEAHFATFPPKLIEPCILAGSKKGDTVLDPFSGAGTTGLVADRLGRNYVGIELNGEYAAMSRRRIADDAPLFGAIAREEMSP